MITMRTKKKAGGVLKILEPPKPLIGKSGPIIARAKKRLALAPA